MFEKLTALFKIGLKTRILKVVSISKIVFQNFRLFSEQKYSAVTLKICKASKMPAHM